MMEAHAAQADAAGIDPQDLRASALRQARWLVSFYGITAQELQGSNILVEAQAAPCEVPIVAMRPVKYRHPVTGDTWDGVGPHPEWLRQALLKDGYRVAELRVDDTLAAGASSTVSDCSF